MAIPYHGALRHRVRRCRQPPASSIQQRIRQEVLVGAPHSDTFAEG